MLLLHFGTRHGICPLRGRGTYDELEYFLFYHFVTTRESEDEDAASCFGSWHHIYFVGGFCIAEKATKGSGQDG